MKRILLSTLAALGGWAQDLTQPAPARWRYNTDPRAARHWHNPADPVQAARIEAAAAKRGKRAFRLNCNMWRSLRDNSAHCTVVPFKSLGQQGRPNLNPFYIAK